MRRKHLVVLVIIVVGLNITVLSMKIWRGQPTDIDQMVIKNRQRAEALEQSLLEKDYHIREAENKEGPFLLRRVLKPSDVGKVRTSEIVVVQDIVLPRLGSRKLHMHATGQQTIRSYDPENASGVCDSSCVSDWVAMDGGPSIMKLSQQKVFEVYPSGEIQIQSSTIRFKNQLMQERIFGAESVVFPENAVAAGDTWTVRPKVPNDAPDIVKRTPPTLTCKCVMGVVFDGVKCVLVTTDATYYLEMTIIQGQKPDIKRFTAKGKVYIDLTTGRDIWSESHAICKEADVTSVVRTHWDLN